MAITKTFLTVRLPGKSHKSIASLGENETPDDRDWEVYKLKAADFL